MNQFREITMSELIRETASRYPDNDALIYPAASLRLTYSEFEKKCVETAKGFMAIGVKKGDHVSVWTTNIPEWLYLQVGLGMIGAVLVTVNTNYKSSELEYILRQSDSTTLVLIEQYRDTNYYETTRTVIPGLDGMKAGSVESESLPFLKNIVYIGNRKETPGMFSFDDVLRLGQSVSDAELAEREKSTHFHDVMNMQYTSGTTGFPKGVMLTHYNVINDARMVGDVMGMTPNDRLLIQVPLFHCFGCVMSSLNCIVHGSTMVMVEYFDPLKALQYIQDEKCTAINGVPTMFIAILGHEDFAKYDMSSLRTGIMAGAPCPVETMKQVTEKMHCPEVVIAFGQTECSPVMTMTRRDDPVEIRVSTVGRLLPGIQGKIIDPATGEDLPPNVQGEIVTKSPCVMKGYYKMPEETKKAIDEQGWLHTGDLGTVDEQGNFKVTGRIKEMIIRGGENIYPREIEEFLHKHPKVRDVYVVGVPDKKYGEQLLAVIIPESSDSLTKEELIEYCNGRIARHKIPKYWEFTSTVPMTASGKVQKYKIVEQYSSRYAS
ncbi:MAG TPA: AMP-binding protein [Deltaproteobacteria bacterium]|jgi:fatty-acyl-CoA synthase|nr:AMP-binding protein [Bacteriovoracaceae bacterium]HNR51854.1 AMP-binding protein [Deltaproteobacteria bacterium]HRR19851.1 AMP-binding protein [Desulfomonilia bacterium]HOS28346.1 AMP-binding protein [Deltaproteobacteria bacterium]HPA83656.1 AMP-binding protein [Deltaproteobacteria bacterium]